MITRIRKFICYFNSIVPHIWTMSGVSWANTIHWLIIPCIDQKHLEIVVKETNKAKEVSARKADAYISKVKQKLAVEYYKERQKNLG